MMPSQSEFINHMKSLHIRKDDTIVCFDHAGVFSSPRVWFTFHTFGASNVKVLDGGLAAWRNKKLPIAPGVILPLVPDKAAPASYGYVKNDDNVVDMNFVNKIFPKILMGKMKHAILDARAAERFEGKVAEPRPGLRSGCIPGSTNIPFKELLNSDGITMKSVNDLRAYFATKSVDLSQPATASCGSGLTACIILLALHRAGANNISLYDGSWAEYVSVDALTKL